MVLRGVSPLYFNIMVVLERQIFSEVVLGVKRLRTTVTALDDSQSYFRVRRVRGFFSEPFGLWTTNYEIINFCF